MKANDGRYEEFEQVNGCVANALMDRVDALEAKIKGMIDRPTIEWKYDKGYPTLFVNGVWVATSQDDKRMDCDKWNEQNMLCEKSRLTKALGMEGEPDA